MGIDGTYKLEIELPTGKESSTVTLKTQGSVLSGVSVAEDGSETSFDGGTVDGNGFSVSVDASGPMGPMQITVTGVVEGDDISGTFTGTGFELKFRGSRV